MKNKILKFIVSLAMVVLFIIITNYIDIHYEDFYTDICRIFVEVFMYIKMINFIDILFNKKK